jgi:hypothetical protein
VAELVSRVRLTEVTEVIVADTVAVAVDVPAKAAVTVPKTNRSIAAVINRKLVI